MSLADEFADDAADIIDEFGEDLVYYQVGQPPRPVKGIVERKSFSMAKAAGGKPQASAHITFKTDAAALGINPATVTFGQDRIGFAYLRGGTALEYTIQRDILLQTPNRWKVLCS